MSTTTFRRIRSAATLICGATLVLLGACTMQQDEEGSVSIYVSTGQGETTTTFLDATTVSGVVHIVADARPRASEIRFFLDDPNEDGDPLHVAREAPFGITLDTAEIADGTHSILVVVVRMTRHGEKATRREATFTVANSSPGTAPEPTRAALSLRGDPEFRESGLGDGARRWYRRVWAAIEHPDAYPNGRRDAQSGSLREYGYAFQQHMMLLFTAFRATGDLQLLDEIARLSDAAAAALTTDWYDPASESWYTPTDGTEGFRRWVYLRSGDTSKHHGKDIHAIGYAKTHAWVAILAYALELNRDLPSPGGVDYGQRADFWLEYLIEDFEAIQHIRRDSAHPDNVFKYLESVGMSVLHSQLTYHYYMHKLTGDSERLEHAEREARTIAGGMWTIDSPLGTAVIFGKPRVPESGLVPITYARYTWALHVDLALDGHPLFSDSAYMAMHAKTLAHFVMDNGSEDLSFDVGGMQDRYGRNWLDPEIAITLPTQNPYTSSGLTWRRESFKRYAISFMAPLAFFGGEPEAEEITTITAEAYANVEADLDDPRRLAIPVGMLLASMR